MEFNVGDIVYSKAGRDSGRYYVVIKSDGLYVQMCDGDLHKFDKPKKKKIKHLKHMEVNSGFIRDKALSNEKITNTELRRTLSEVEEHLRISASGAE